VFILNQIINWLKKYTNKISILFYFADSKESNLSKKLIYDIADLFESKNLLSDCEFIILSALKFFYVSEVQAFLIGDSQKSSACVCDFYIVAKKNDEAINYIIEHLEKEGFEFIKYKKILEYEYYQLPDLLKETLSPPSQEGIYYKSRLCRIE
jgi:hypothetical protein